MYAVYISAYININMRTHTKNKNMYSPVHKHAGVSLWTCLVSAIFKPRGFLSTMRIVAASKPFPNPLPPRLAGRSSWNHVELFSITWYFFAILKPGPKYQPILQNIVDMQYLFASTRHNGFMVKLLGNSASRPGAASFHDARFGGDVRRNYELTTLKHRSKQWLPHMCPSLDYSNNFNRTQG